MEVHFQDCVRSCVGCTMLLPCQRRWLMTFQLLWSSVHGRIPCIGSLWIYRPPFCHPFSKITKCLSRPCPVIGEDGRAPNYITMAYSPAFIHVYYEMDE